MFVGLTLAFICERLRKRHILGRLREQGRSIRGRPEQPARACIFPTVRDLFIFVQGQRHGRVSALELA